MSSDIDFNTSAATIENSGNEESRIYHEAIKKL